MEQKKNATLRAAWISILVTIILIGAKLMAALLSGSLALVSLAAESAFDFFSVLLTLFAVRISAKPPDSDHPYGHGKFDNLIGLFQSLILLGISFWIFYTALGRLLHPSQVQLTVDYVTFAILIGSFVLDFWRSRKLQAIGKQERLQALQSDAIHFFSDSLSVIVVFIGLIFSKYLHLEGADSYAAMLVAGFVSILSLRQGKTALDALTDRYAHTEDYQKASQVIKNIDGVYGIESLRMRHSGPDLFIEAAIAINRILPFATVEHILSEIKIKLEKEFPGAEINLRSHAIKLEHESTFETIKLITSEQGLLPHNIELSKDEKGLVTLDLHLEFPPESSFAEAHRKSEIIEAHIKEHLSNISKIILHLEEERPDYAMTTVHDITSSNVDLSNQMSDFARTLHPAIRDIRDFQLLESDPYKEKKLTFVLVLNKNLSLSGAHAIVTEVEQALRNKYPDLARIVIHSEPE